MSERSAQIAMLHGMGFHPAACQRALQVTNGSLDRAIDWLLSIQNSDVDLILSNGGVDRAKVDHFAACFSDLQAGSSSSVTPRSQRARLRAASGALDDECRSPVSLDECVSGFGRLQMRDSDEQSSADNSSDSPESAWRAAWRAGDGGNRSQAFSSRERFPMPSRDLSFGQYSNVGGGNACGKRGEGRQFETSARGRKGEGSANASFCQSRRSAGSGNADVNQRFERLHPQTTAAPLQSFTADPEQKAEANLRRGRIPNLPKNVKDKLHQIAHSADTIGKFSKMANPFRDPASKYDPAVQLFLDSMTQADPAPIKLAKNKIAQVNEALVKRGQMKLSPSAKRNANKIVHATDTVGPWSQTPNEFRDPEGKFDPKAQEVLNQMKAASLGLEFANSGYQDFVERHALDSIALEQLEQIERSKGFCTELQFNGLLQQIVRMSDDREVQAQRQAGSNVPFEPCFSHRHHNSDDDFQRDRQNSDESDEKFARAEFRGPIGANISRGDAARGRHYQNTRCDRFFEDSDEDDGRHSGPSCTNRQHHVSRVDHDRERELMMIEAQREEEAAQEAERRARNQRQEEYDDWDGGSPSDYAPPRHDGGYSPASRSHHETDDDVYHPRCGDDSLDMRYAVNRGLDKYND